MLNVSIKITLHELKNLENESKKIENNIINSTPIVIHKPFLESQKQAQRKIHTIAKIRTSKKISNLNNNMRLPLNIDGTPLHKVFNFSNVQLPKETEYMLSLGPNFALNPPNNRTPYYDLIAECESIISNIQTENREEARGDFVNMLTNHLNNSHKTKPDKQSQLLQLNYEKTKAFIDLQNQIDPLVIIPSDKGNHTCVLKQETYKNCVHDLIDDDSTYIKCDNDPTTMITRRANQFIQRLHEKKFIDDNQRRKLITTAPTAPRLYALPKVHKMKDPDDKLKGRPIVACNNAPFYKLASFMSDILTKAFKGKYNIKNSFDFVEKLKTLSPKKQQIMLSMDVESLFTNITHSRFLKSVEKRWEDIQNHTKMPKETFLDMLNFILRNGYFMYEGDIFKQREGLPMGSPLSAIAAMYVMEDIMDWLIEEQGIDFECLAVYMDDTFMLMDVDEVENTLTVINTYDEKLKFTYEIEEENSITFLDVKITRHDHHLTTEWFSKPTSSQRILNYNSNHHLKQKLNVVDGLINRVHKLTSNATKSKVLETTKKILLKNGYRTNTIKRRIDRYYKSSNDKPEKEKPEKIYIPTTSLPEITPKLQRITNKYNPKINLAPRNRWTLKQLYTKVKDPINKWHKSNLVYSIPCTCKKEYVGKTDRQYLKTRIDQHTGDCKKIEKCSRDQNFSNDNLIRQIQSAMSEAGEEKKEELSKFHRLCEKSGLTTHMASTGHSFNFQDTKIVSQNNNYHKNTIMEMIAIKQSDNINKQTDTNSLSSAYNGLLQKIKQREKFRNNTPAETESEIPSRLQSASQ
jgi:hypothetical protein